ncbi:PQQ-binding-like beta-propeller repeat protein [Streptomyces beijiangensis]|uniref:outer membrane protein assembly factor BamB family protein n=1 Tax=Streptomyces beijiangensis TaxID=163361 RepID=UPI0031D40CDD
MAAVLLSMALALLVAAAPEPPETPAVKKREAITTSNVAKLKTKWVFTATDDVQVTPAVRDGITYFSDYGGYVYAVKASTGALIWKGYVPDYTGSPNAIARTNPVVSGDLLILGDNHKIWKPHQGAHLFALNRWTGRLVWNTQVDAHEAAVITADPVVRGSRIYAGVSSIEEGYASSAGYKCCTFRGSVVSVDLRTGRLIWQTHTLPSRLVTACTATDCGYSGNAVWSKPVVDPATGTLYTATGNNYTVPESVEACVRKALEDKVSFDHCSDPENLQETVLALDLDTGRVKWSHRVSGYDAWIVACPEDPVSWCPDPGGEDFDFGSGPDLFRIHDKRGSRKVVGVGQKSGVYWAFDAKNGSLVWKTLVGPGSLYGGIMHGTTVDDKRIYMPIGNVDRKPYVLQPSGRTATAGSWSALDKNTGKILWQTADPGPRVPFDIGKPTVTGGVVFVGSQDPDKNNMYALDARTGKILWGFPSGGSVGRGPAVVDGTVYWGSGYTLAKILFGGASNNKLYAFSVNGR